MHPFGAWEVNTAGMRSMIYITGSCHCASIWSREVSTPGMRSVIYFSGACDCVSIRSMGGEHARYVVNDIH